MAHEEWLERAEFYALRALDGGELAQFEAHLSSGCSFCKAKVRETGELFVQLPSSFEPLAPPGNVKTRIFEQIDKEKPAYHFVHASEGEWQRMAPGIVAKVLSIVAKVLSMDVARQRVTALVRMEPAPA